MHDFVSGELETIDPRGSGDATAHGGHLGGDHALMDAFVKAVETGERRHILSGADQSLHSHLAVFAAERARTRGIVADIDPRA